VPDAALTNGEASGLTDSTIRVDVALLDGLMRLVGELVLAATRSSNGRWRSRTPC
jgi:chemotaxis protein histidine kinase CheA